MLSPEKLTLLQTGLEALDRLDQVREALGKDELVKVTERTGAVHANPLLRAEKDARSQFLSKLDGTATGTPRLLRQCRNRARD